MQYKIILATALCLGLIVGPVWSQGALNLAGLPELDETDEDGTKPEHNKPVTEIYGSVVRTSPRTSAMTASGSSSHFDTDTRSGSERTSNTRASPIPTWIE